MGKTRARLARKMGTRTTTKVAFNPQTLKEMILTFLEIDN